MLNDYKKTKIKNILDNLSPANDTSKAQVNIQNSVIDNHIENKIDTSPILFILFILVFYIVGKVIFF